jgi:hypothetical protein
MSHNPERPSEFPNKSGDGHYFKPTEWMGDWCERCGGNFRGHPSLTVRVSRNGEMG